MSIDNLTQAKLAEKAARTPHRSRKTQGEKYSLSLTGEFYVAAELQRRHVHASVSYGTAKNADVYAFAPSTNRYVKVEVKTTREGEARWKTGGDSMSDTMISDDVFWVLVWVPVAEDQAPEFYVLSSEELIRAVQSEGELYNGKYRAKHGVDFEMSKGVHGVPVAKIRGMKNVKGAWTKISDRLSLIDKSCPK